MGCADHIGSISVYSFCSQTMVAPLQPRKRMTDEDRLNYLINELEALKEKQKRFKKDTVRSREDLDFYTKCNDYYINQIQIEIHKLQQK